MNAPQEIVLPDFDFVNKVEVGLKRCSIVSQKLNTIDRNNSAVHNRLCLLLAVSGGVDSMVMLQTMHILSKKYAFSLRIVTVNHNMRPASESFDDADFVKTYCSDVLNLPCTVITIPPGDIVRIEKERSRGTEEAARHVRYEAIETCAKSHNADFVLFAHNRNDQLETLLQHFLQGAENVAGMQTVRLFRSKHNEIAFTLARPLLHIPRSEIEQYAKNQKIPFREDSTNEQDIYYRNKIRHKLVPVLNEYFSGWDTGVLSGSEKARSRSEFIEKCAKSVQWETKGTVKIKTDVFFACDFPVRIRVLYNGLYFAGVKNRIPYKILKDCAEGKKRVQGAGLDLIQRGCYLFIEKLAHDEKKSYAHDIDVVKCGRYEVPYGIFEVTEDIQKNEHYTDIETEDYCVGHFFLPLRIRSKQQSDTIMTATGHHKSLKKIFSEWRVLYEHRHLIPIIEQNGQPMCIWGDLYGYPNWYVKQENNKKGKYVFVRFIRNII